MFSGSVAPHTSEQPLFTASLYLHQKASSPSQDTHCSEITYLVYEEIYRDQNICEVSCPRLKLDPRDRSTLAQTAPRVNVDPVSQTPQSQPYSFNLLPRSPLSHVKIHTNLYWTTKMSSLAATEWRKDEFLISTSQDLLQPSAVNNAFASEYMYWTKRMSPDAMLKTLRHSFCFGVYLVPNPGSSNHSSPHQSPKMTNPSSQYQHKSA